MYYSYNFERWLIEYFEGDMCEVCMSFDNENLHNQFLIWRGKDEINKV